MTKLDDVIQGISELTEAVKGKENPKTELQWDDVKEQFEGHIKELVDAQVQAKADAQPQRRVPGEIIGPDGSDLASKIGKGNAYTKAVRDISQDGYTRRLGKNVTAFDLWLAKGMMETQVKHWNARMGPKPVGPSDDLQAAIKALTSTGSGTGDELVPTGMANQLWDDIFLMSKIVTNMVTIDMPTNPFDVPLGLGAVTWYKGTENTATTASDPATAKSTLTATELVTEQNWSYTLNEDAVVAMAPEVRARLAQSGAEIIDDFALNADSTNAATGNINLDDADPADNLHYLSAGQDGIRHQWLVDNTAMTTNAGGDALADADITGTLANMTKYAVNPNDVFLVCDSSTYLNGFLTLTNVIGLDKIGADNVILTGQLAAYRGIPIIVSASHPLAEADGKVSTTAASNTLGSISILNRRMWYAGFLRSLLIEMDRDIQKRQFIMVTSLREAVAAHGTRSTNTHTAGIRNILV